jgi:hypothetical protein
MNKGDTNIDHQDLLEAQGAFVDEEDPRQWASEYEQWLDEVYNKDRKQRQSLETKKVRF